MLHINIICVGKIKEKYLKDAIEEYSKRLSKYCTLNIKELSDIPIPNNASNSIEEKIKASESSLILSQIKKDDYTFSLDLNGKQYTSEEFAQKIGQIEQISSTINFIIGGTLGLDDNVRQKSNELICFSKMTFPHQLIRVFLLEQIFRIFKIRNNETYHR